jgi:serine/threonine protein kinase
MDLYALLHPKEATWNISGQGWLVGIYDWDLVVVDAHVVAALSFGLNLCVGLFPCSMRIKGNPVGVIQRQKSGHMTCLASNGCQSLILEGVSIFCDGTQHQMSTFKIQGSNLTIFNSAFAGCVSSTDGSVIQSFDRSTVVINVSSFSDAHSAGFGGAIAAYGGSVNAFNSSFSNCSASGGGGAIWASAYQSIYGDSQYHDTVLEIKASIFANCSAGGNGGAILASSDASESGSINENLDVEIQSSTFTSCRSSGFGGAIHLSGYSVTAEISSVIYSCASTYSGGAISAGHGVSLALNGSVIHNNIASGCGGAISANNSEIVVVNSVINYNKALGFGGGAMFLKDTSLFVSGTSCRGNRAPTGGGGVLLSHGSVFSPAAEVITNLCNQDNFAIYGPCFASECKTLKITYNSSESMWTGLPFKLAVTKLDAYQQIILTDYSLLQVLPSTSNVTSVEDRTPSFSFVGSSVSQFTRGFASIELAIQASFVDINTAAGVARVQTQPHPIFVQTTDEQTDSPTKSGLVFIRLNSCVPGYELSLLSQTCQLCPANYFCVGGSQVREACPIDRSSSSPGANESKFCNSAYTLPTPVVIGLSMGTIVLIAVLIAGVFWLTFKIRKHYELKECVAAVSCANAGCEAFNKHIPPDLRKTYSPESILSRGAGGNACVVKARQVSTNTPVAIKVVLPLAKTFKDSELDQLRREAYVLTMFSEKKYAYSAQLLHGSGQGGVGISSDMCWFIMDFLKGESMDAVIYPSRGDGGAREHLLEGKTVDQVECIHAVRDVLAALKIVHGEAMLHLNIQPSNIFRCKAAENNESREFTYRLIGYGTAQHTGDSASKDVMASSAVKKSITAGKHSYMSPEMFREPGNATCSADFWSLGVTMYELVTKTHPFQAGPGGKQNWAAVISGNMEEKAPNLLDRINADMRSVFDHSLALVTAKALEKEAINRYFSADDMHGAVFGCLVKNGKYLYSAYLTCRAESDWPLFKLLIDELNHSKTPGGHRVTVYFNHCTGSGHDQGSNWDEHIANGLLHSICFFPILSFGLNAPRSALGGAEQNRENALIKEILIACALLERSSKSGVLLDGESGQLHAAVPIFVGQQLQQGSLEYPSKGNYLDVQGGSGLFSELPSPSNSQAASLFLRDRAGLPVEVVKQVQERRVASALASMAKLEGCHLCNQTDDSVEAVLTTEQKALVGKGYAGHLVNLDDKLVSTELVITHPTGGW